MLDWNRVNEWSHTFYTLVHSLNIAHQIHFGNPTYLDESFRIAADWVVPDCSYASVLKNHESGGRTLTFRRDPNKHFRIVSRNLLKLLIQDLVVILDEMLSEVLRQRGVTAGTYPKSKLEKLATYLSPQYLWSYQGCVELVAVRNVLVHNGGKWNRKSIDFISGFVTPPPSEGDSLSIGLSMLLNYRKAMRTFINEVKVQ